MLTGGLHDRSLIASSLRTRACDLVGIGRPACVNPTLPRDVILDCGLHADETRLGGYRIRGAATMRYIMGGGRSTATASKPGKPVVASYAERGYGSVSLAADLGAGGRAGEGEAKVRNI